MYLNESIPIDIKEKSFKKVYSSPYNLIKPPVNPSKISKKLRQMQFHMDKLYTAFYRGSMDPKLIKQVEEYNRIQKFENLRLANLIKDLRVYFRSKENREYKLKSKSSKNIYSMGILKILYSKILFTFRMENKISDIFHPFLFPVKKEEKIRLKCITEFKMINIIKKFKSKSPTKNDYLSSFMRKRKKRMLQKIKVIKSKNNIDNINNKNKTFFIPKNNSFNDVKNPPSFYINKNTTKNNFSIRIKYKLKENDNKINSSDINSKNFYKINKPFTPKIMFKNNREQSKSLLDIKKSGFKIYPLINSSFISSLKKSNSFIRQIDYFQKESSYFSQKEKKKKSRIIKKYFSDAIKINIKSTIQIGNKKSRKKKYKYIYEDRNGKINLKFNFVKREKSLLMFVRDYNKLRNRKRRNNQVDENLGFGVQSLKKREIFLNQSSS